MWRASRISQRSKPDSRSVRRKRAHGAARAGGVEERFEGVGDVVGGDRLAVGEAEPSRSVMSQSLPTGTTLSASSILRSSVCVSVDTSGA